ncbi:hypothetical protein [Lentzea sp. NEAU-D7]|uniref:hypothetical protein n=1 Tax=Lentzea sp. NEAU-D7 TaxID=2994667 RepID=UPI00224B29D8|nr:hypothetical protein [Lentzea sp. NEAU-D7]
MLLPPVFDVFATFVEFGVRTELDEWPRGIQSRVERTAQPVWAALGTFPPRRRKCGQPKMIHTVPEVGYRIDP